MTDIANVDLDLDALEPKAVQINYKGELIKVDPLSTAQYAKLVNISAEIVEAQKTEDAEVMTTLIEKLKTLIDEIIPSLADKNLNPQQILAIYKLLVQVSHPEDKAVKALEEQGISISKGGDGDPKDLTSSEPSPAS